MLNHGFQDFHRVVEEAAAAAVDLEVADVGAEVREAVLVVEAAVEAADVEVLEEAEVVAVEVLETAAVLETVEDEVVVSTTIYQFLQSLTFDLLQDVVLEAVEVAVEVVEAGEDAVAVGVDSKEAKLLVRQFSLISVV